MKQRKESASQIVIFTEGFSNLFEDRRQIVILANNDCQLTQDYRQEGHEVEVDSHVKESD